MNEKESHVVELIQSAFRGVSLGDGVGLRQGRGLDDYADSRTLAEYRAQDERQDWSAIPFDDLVHYSDTLAFLDAEGMRFHLPAFLIADIQGDGPEIVFHLTYAANEGDSRFDLLNPAQRQAVREFLLLKLTQLDEPSREFEAPLIENALEKYWTD